MNEMVYSNKIDLKWCFYIFLTLFQPSYSYVISPASLHSRFINIHPRNSFCSIQNDVLSSRSCSSLSMISFSTPSSDTSFPRDVKEAVSKCRAAVQTALENRLSRMDIEMPVGAKFGVEKPSNKNSKQKKSEMMNDGSSQSKLTYESLQTSDRELARLFVEMFQPVGGNAISTVFMDGLSASKASKTWKNEVGAECQIHCITKSQLSSSGKKKKQTRGFAAKMAAELDESIGKPFTLPPNCEVAIFVSPGPKELITIETIANEVGMGTLIILLNARLASVSNYNTPEAKKLFTEEFEPVFHLGAAPQEYSPGCLVHRAYPNDWLLARKPKVGQPKVIAQQSNRFSNEECQDAYENMEVGEMEEAVENVIENVANWFK